MYIASTAGQSKGCMLPFHETRSIPSHFTILLFSRNYLLACADCWGAEEDGNIGSPCIDLFCKLLRGQGHHGVALSCSLGGLEGCVSLM